MAKIIVTLNALKVANIFASTEKTRYYLNGVYFDFAASGLRLVSIDGHRLAVIKPNAEFASVAGECAPFILPSEAIKSLAPPVKRKGKTAYVAIDTNSNIIACAALKKLDDKSNFDKIIGTGMRLPFVPIDGTYPNYLGVIPKPECFTTPAPGGTAFNAQYLGDFQALDPFLHRITLYSNNDAEAQHIVRSSSLHYDAIGVIMPMRNAVPSEQMIPDWLELPAVAPEQEERTKPESGEG